MAKESFPRVGDLFRENRALRQQVAELQAEVTRLRQVEQKYDDFMTWLKRELIGKGVEDKIS